MAQLKDTLVTGDLAVTGKYYGDGAELKNVLHNISNATNGGITVTGSTVTGSITVGHSNSVTAQTTQALYPIKIDANGHISGYGSAVTSITPSSHSHGNITNAGVVSTSVTIATGDRLAIVDNSDSNKLTGANISFDTSETRKFLTQAGTWVSVPEPMVFKGTLGTGGTTATLPTASSSNIGWTYKVITAQTTPAAKVGDTVISDGSTWVVVPSGDEPSGTVTNVAAGAGLNTTSADTSTDGGTITSSGTLYLTKTAVTPGTYQGITVDKYGRVTGASNQGYITGVTGVSPITVTGTSISHANSGATAGGYGPSAGGALSYGGSFTVPQFTINATGHVTSATPRVYTLPASDNTDTKQNVTLATTSKAFVTGVTTTPTGTAQALTGVADTGVYLTTTAGQLNATTYKVNEAVTMQYNSTSKSLDFIFA